MDSSRLHTAHNSPLASARGNGCPWGCGALAVLRPPPCPIGTTSCHLGAIIPGLRKDLTPRLVRDRPPHRCPRVRTFQVKWKAGSSLQLHSQLSPEPAQGRLGRRRLMKRHRARASKRTLGPFEPTQLSSHVRRSSSESDLIPSIVASNINVIHHTVSPRPLLSDVDWRGVRFEIRLP